MLTAFSDRVFVESPEATELPSKDACLLLSFACVMLNTSLHTRALAAKRDRHTMTIDGFLLQNSEYDANTSRGQRTPESLLRGIYASIEATPFQVPEEADGLGWCLDCLVRAARPFADLPCAWSVGAMCDEAW